MRPRYTKGGQKRAQPQEDTQQRKEKRNLEE